MIGRDGTERIAAVGESIGRRKRVRVLRAECSFPGREDPAMQWFCSRVVACMLKQNREVVRARERVRMLGAEFFFPGSEDPAMQGLCPRLVALIAEQNR